MHDSFYATTIGPYLASLMAVLGLMLLVWMLNLRLAPTRAFRRLKAAALTLYIAGGVVSLLPVAVARFAATPVTFLPVTEITTPLSAMALLAAIALTLSALLAAGIRRLRT